MTPSAMSSSEAQTASIFGCLDRKSCITLKASSRFQLAYCLSITFTPEPSSAFSKFVTRSSSITVGMPRKTTTLPCFEVVDEVLAGDAAEFRVVARHIDVLDRRILQAAIDDRDESAALLDFADGVRQLVRVEGQNHERVDLLRGQIVERVRLRCAVRRGLHDDLEARIGLLELLGGFLGVIDDAAGPAMGRGRNRNADRHVFLLRHRAAWQARHQARGGCESSVPFFSCHSSLRVGLSPFVVRWALAGFIARDAD